jgi:MtN3 and saliva related transmembrane protein
VFLRVLVVKIRFFKTFISGPCRIIEGHVMISVDLIGYLAALCTTTAFLPQAVKTIRSKDTHSLSLGMYSLFTVGVILWLMYGIYRQDPAIVLANAITGLLSLVILFHKLRNDVLRK